VKFDGKVGFGFWAGHGGFGGWFWVGVFSGVEMLVALVAVQCICGRGGLRVGRVWAGSIFGLWPILVRFL